MIEEDTQHALLASAYASTGIYISTHKRMHHTLPHHKHTTEGNYRERNGTRGTGNRKG